MSRLKAIRQGIDHSKAINFPGTSERVRIAVLSSAENDAALLATEAHCTELKITDPIRRDIELQRQLVFRFLRTDGDLHVKAADSIDEIRELSDDQIAALMDEYHTLKQECDPSIGAISEEDFEKLKEELKKTDPRALNGGTARLLTSLQLTLASSR